MSGDVAADVAALCAKFEVPYDDLQDALCAMLGKLGSAFDDDAKRGVLNNVSDKNLAVVSKELGKTYRFKETTPWIGTPTPPREVLPPPPETSPCAAPPPEPEPEPEPAAAPEPEESDDDDRE